MANKGKTLFLSIIYFLVVILPHEWVGLKINKAFSGMSRDQYNLIILILFSFILLSLLVFLFKKISNHPLRNQLILCFGFTIVSMCLVNNFLFVINIENVHYVQYAVGAILIFSLIEHYFATLFLACLVGVFDEAYQYFYLAPERTDYYDFNDVITNLLGAAMGLLILRTLRFPETENRKNTLVKAFVIPLLAFIILVVGMLMTKILSVYPADDKFTLVRKIQEGFWTTVPPKVRFHVLDPLEGLLIISAMFLIYYFCFRSKIARTN